MKKRACLALAACLLASVGCQPSSTLPQVAAPLQSQSAAKMPPQKSLITPVAIRATHPLSLRYRVTLIESDENDDLLRINNRGQVLFQHHLMQGNRPIALNLPIHNPYYSDGSSAATDINNAGVVVGTSDFDTKWGDIISRRSQALVWQNGKGAIYPFVNPPSNIGATAINNRGEIAGYYYKTNDETDQVGQRAFFCKDHVLTDIGQGCAVCLNDKGQVVVTHHPFALSGEQPPKHSFVWEKGEQTPIIPPPGYDPAADGVSINNSGEVAGVLLHSNVNGKDGSWQEAYVWRSGRMTMLGTLGGKESITHGINNEGQIVGSAEALPWNADTYSLSLPHGLLKEGNNSNPTPHAFLWQDGRIYDLNAFIPTKSGWELNDAVSINDKGQIVGTGSKGVFLLTPLNARH